MGAEVSGRKGLGKILEYGLRLKLEDGSIWREAGGFSRSVLPGLAKPLSGLLSDYKPGLEILESSWQNTQADYDGGSSIAA